MKGEFLNVLKNRALFAFVSGRLGEFYSGSGAPIQPRNTHDFSKNVVHFIVVPFHKVLQKEREETSL